MEVHSLIFFHGRTAIRHESIGLSSWLFSAARGPNIGGLFIGVEVRRTRWQDGRRFSTLLLPRDSGIVVDGASLVSPLKIKPDEALAARERVYRDPAIVANDDARILASYMAQAATSVDSKTALQQQLQTIAARLKAIEANVAQLTPQLQRSYEQIKRELIELMWEYKVISWKAKGLQQALKGNASSSSSLPYKSSALRCIDCTIKEFPKAWLFPSAIINFQAPNLLQGAGIIKPNNRRGH